MFLFALLPQNCVLCSDLSGNEPLCPACLSTLPTLTQAGCPVCAMPTLNGATCNVCLGSPPAFDATTALFAYAFPAIELVHSLKYRSQLALAKFFARSLAQIVDPIGIDTILALPLHTKRLRYRGFNQAQEIARPLAKHLGLPLLANICKRTLHTSAQAHLSSHARAKNMRGAFSCSEDLSGKSIAVIDDVITSGATLNELAATLKEHGAHRVTNWVVARTLPDSM